MQQSLIKLPSQKNKVQLLESCKFLPQSQSQHIHILFKHFMGIFFVIKERITLVQVLLTFWWLRQSTRYSHNFGKSAQNVHKILISDWSHPQEVDEVILVSRSKGLKLFVIRMLSKSERKTSFALLSKYTLYMYTSAKFYLILRQNSSIPYDPPCSTLRLR